MAIWFRPAASNELPRGICVCRFGFSRIGTAEAEPTIERRSKLRGCLFMILQIFDCSNGVDCTGVNQDPDHGADGEIPIIKFCSCAIRLCISATIKTIRRQQRKNFYLNWMTIT